MLGFLILGSLLRTSAVRTLPSELILGFVSSATPSDPKKYTIAMIAMCAFQVTIIIAPG